MTTLAPLSPGVAKSFEPKTRAQRRIMFSGAPVVAVSGGWGSGKTLPAAVRVVRKCDAYPGLEAACCMDEAASLPGGIERALRERAIPPAWSFWQQGFGWKEEGAGALYFPRRGGRQSIAWMVGLNKPERLYSRNLHTMVIDQAEQIAYDQLVK